MLILNQIIQMMNESKIMFKPSFKASRLSLVLASALLLTPLTACVDKDLPANIIEDLNQASRFLEVSLRFELSSPRPGWLAGAQRVELEILTRGSTQPVRDQFELQLSATTTELVRSLSRVRAGQANIEIKFLAADGSTLKQVSQALNLQNNPESLVIQMQENPSILLAAQLETNLSPAALRQQQSQLLQEIQQLARQETELSQQLGLVLASPLLEDQFEKQRLQAELQSNRNSQTEKQQSLDNLTLQLNRLQAQGTSGSSGSNALGFQIDDLRRQATSLNAEISALLEQRRRLSAESSSLASSGSGALELDALRVEIQGLDQQIDAKVSELENLSRSLSQLETQVSSQNQSQPAAEQNAQLQAELQTLNAQISSLQAEINQLNTQIQALIHREDMFSLDRRDQLEAQLSAKTAELAALQARKLRLEASLR